jgi:hypothetical protein
MKVKNIILSIVIFALVGCGISVNVSSRSGSNSDDYVEEPLSERVIEYSNALETANYFLDSIISNNYSDTYELLDESLTINNSQENFQALLTKDDEVLGEIKEYLKNQWAFNNATFDGKKYLQLTKIVKYEKYTFSYIFTFPYDSKYKKLAGFTFKEKTALL